MVTQVQWESDEPKGLPFVSKPFTPDVLLAQVPQVLDNPITTRRPGDAVLREGGLQATGPGVGRT